MIRFSTLLLCALSTASLALPLQAADAAPTGIGTTSTEIDLSSLDLTATRDWTIANQKIARASHAVCQKLIQDNWLVDSDGADCEQDAFSRAPRPSAAGPVPISPSPMALKSGRPPRSTPHNLHGPNLQTGMAGRT